MYARANMGHPSIPYRGYGGTQEPHMKRVITAAILIPLVLVILIKGSFLMVAALCALVAGLAGWEFLNLADAHGAHTPRSLVLAAIAGLFAATYWNASLIMPVIGGSTLVLLLVCSFRSPLERVLPDCSYSVLSLLYCGLTLATLPLVWRQPDGPSLIVLLLCVVWTGDIAGLYVGRNFGRTRLAPRLSPNKSWEGSGASLAGGLLIAAALVALSRTLGWLHFQGSVAHWLVVAAVLNVFAQAGDLVESAIKRGAGVKDSGALLPGHGGMLDRIDALLLAAPALWYAQWIQQFLERASLR